MLYGQLTTHAISHYDWFLHKISVVIYECDGQKQTVSSPSSKPKEELAGEGIDEAKAFRAKVAISLH